jgi:hypothetical protein
MTNTFETSQTRKKTQDRPEQDFFLTRPTHFFKISDLVCKMKFEFHTVAALALLLVGPVHGGRSGGLRKTQQVRVCGGQLFAP